MALGPLATVCQRTQYGGECSAAAHRQQVPLLYTLLYLPAAQRDPEQRDPEQLVRVLVLVLPRGQVWQMF